MAEPYRNIKLIRHVGDAGCFSSDGEVKLIGFVDVSGHNGRHAQAGQSLRTPSRQYGMHGRRGGDATPAIRGQSAGRVQCRLKYDRNDRDTGRLTIEGTIAYAADRPSALAESIEIGVDGYVFLNAVGGRGGNGGRGGDGQPGTVGVRGRNATRFS
ncbi:MAG: hypothetical protein ACR2NZ_25215, partial [Rubripirellula sp.]